MLKAIVSLADLNEACNEMRPVIAKVDTESFMIGCAFEMGGKIHITGRRDDHSVVDREITPDELCHYSMLSVDIDEWHDNPVILAKHEGRAISLTSTEDYGVKLRAL